MKIGISCCSNGQKPEYEKNVDGVCSWLEGLGIQTVRVNHLYRKPGNVENGSGRERAQDLMELYRNPDIGIIFDVSGGDLANEVLPYLDYDLIAKSGKEFWGYSDLTTIINSIYTMTGKSSVLYQAKHLVNEFAESQQSMVKDVILNNGSSLFDIDYEFVQGSSMEGIVLGGNIRCLLKLAGTRFWPDMNGKVLVLEGYGGDEAEIRTLITQLDTMGVFSQVSGVLIGTYTKYEASEPRIPVYRLLLDHVDPSLPVAVTRDIGHGLDAKALRIGEWRRF